ncbi:uncharacterized protein MONBRDRAFT_24010, partial [Monosiga brevicollis MX1]
MASPNLSQKANDLPALSNDGDNEAAARHLQSRLLEAQPHRSSGRGGFKLAKPAHHASTGRQNGTGRTAGRSLRLAPLDDGKLRSDVQFSQHKPLPPSAGDGAKIAAPSDLGYAGDNHIAALADASMDDILAYVQAHPDIGFVYALPRAPQESVERSMYDLRVVPAADIYHVFPYFTISPDGVTCVQATTSEFHSLPRFIKDVALTKRLKQMPLVYQFRQWKAFTTWRKAITGARRHARGEFLQRHLYLLSTFLQPALLRVRAMCLDIVEARLAVIRETEAPTISEFVAQQHKQVTAVAERLRTFRDDIAAVALEACQRVLVEAGYTGTSSCRGLWHHSLVRHMFSRAPTSLLTCVVPLDDRDMSYTEQGQKQALCVRLARFLRLIDKLVASAMQELAVESIVFLSDHATRIRRVALEQGQAAYDEAVQAAKEQAAHQAAEATAAKQKKSKGKPVEPVEVAPAIPGQDGVPLPPGLVQVTDGYVVLRRVKADAPASTSTSTSTSNSKNANNAKADRQGPRAMFKVALELDTDGLTFAPDGDDIKGALRQLLDRFSRAVCGVEAVARHRDFVSINEWAQMLPEQAEDETQALESMLKGDRHMYASFDALLAAVDFGFAAAGEYRASLQDIQERFAESTA